MDKNDLRDFLGAINRERSTGKASESSYYPALANFFRAISSDIIPQILPKGEEIGIPDVKIYFKQNSVGYIEVKDPEVISEIDRIAEDSKSGKSNPNTIQFKKYLSVHNNIIYTNLKSWRRYRKGDYTPVQVSNPIILKGGQFRINPKEIDSFSQLLDGFINTEPEIQTTVRGLAYEMAKLTRVLRDNAADLLKNKNNYLLSLQEAFKQELIKDITNQEFADMYAETVAYGLFTAHYMEPVLKFFTREQAAQFIPRSNPFLRKVFKSLVDRDNMPKELTWIIDDLTTLNYRSDMGEIGKELAAYGQKREQRQ